VLDGANRENEVVRLKLEKQCEMQQRQLQDYEHKFQKKTKELQSVKEKADTYNKEKQENSQAHKEERQKFKQDIKEANDEINLLAHKVDQLEEQLKIEQGNADDLMREIRSGYEDQLRDLQSKHRKSMMEATELRN